MVQAATVSMATVPVIYCKCSVKYFIVQRKLNKLYVQTKQRETDRTKYSSWISGGKGSC